MKSFLYVFIILFFASCGGGGTGGSTSTDLSSVDETTEEISIRDETTIYINSDKTALEDDEFSSYQWHRAKLDFDTLNQTYNGFNSADPNNGPIIVQVVDDGLQIDHEDLRDNISSSGSYNEETGLFDPSPETGSTHGTSVAGIIGAVGYNDIGLKGIAPASELVGYKFETDSNGNLTGGDDMEIAWLSGENADNIVISNNSWGICSYNGTDLESILAVGSEGGDYDSVTYSALRGGLGRLYVFAAGNEREGNPSACFDPNPATSNTSYLTNNQYAITVAAVGSDNKYSSYSSPGANILVSGYSDDIGTTVPMGTSTSGITWSGDVYRNYTNKFNGTSAAAPFVSGTLALVLEACPNLSYRDIKYLIATTALNDEDGIDPDKESLWTENSAGVRHSNDYGFGIINPQGMIDACTSTSYSYLNQVTNPKLTSTTTDTFSSEILGPHETLSETLTVTEDMTIEWVGLTTTSDYPFPGNLQIKLISPSGVESELLHFDNNLGTGYRFFFHSGFRLSSQAFMGENSIGTWTVEITSNIFAIGNLSELSLEIVGH